MLHFESGDLLPVCPTYNNRCVRVDFWRRSYVVDEDYLDGEGPKGQQLLVQMPCEEPQDFEIRKRVSETRNYVGPVVNRYVGAIFRRYPARDQESQITALLDETLEDGLQEFMKSLTREVMIQGRNAIAIGSTEDSMPTLRRFDDKDILMVETDEDIPIGVLLNLWFDEQSHKGVARYYTADQYQDVQYTGRPPSAVIDSFEEPVSHGMPVIPVVIVEPFKDSSFSSPIANGQVKIINLLSLLSTEIADNTFTRWVLAGVRDLSGSQAPSPEGILQDRPPVVWSTKRIMTFEEPDVGVHRLGADVGQAESIRSSVKEAEEHLYRAAGVGANYNVDSGGEQSGLSRLVQLEDFQIYANDIIQAIEKAENAILWILHDTAGREFIPTAYSTDVLDKQWDRDIARIRDLREIGIIPEEVLYYMVIQLVDQMVELPDDLRELLSANAE